MHRTFRSIGFAVVVVAVALTAVSTVSRAAEQTRDTLKTYFETGDVPTQQQFANMIDSYISLSEDRDLLGLRNAPGGLAELLSAGELIDSSSVFGPAVGLGSDWIGQSGFVGLTFQENAQVHFGYVHIITDVDGLGTLYPIGIDRFGFDDVPGAGITIAAIPEPSTCALLLGGTSLLGLARRGRAPAHERRRA